ncbi:MAG: OmpA family protein [Elusimicrobiota bacterium]
MSINNRSVKRRTMMRSINYLAVGLLCVLVSGCVSAGKYRMKVVEVENLADTKYELVSKLKEAEKSVETISTERQRIEVEGSELKEQYANLQKDSSNLISALEAKKTEKDQLIADLTVSKQEKESTVLSLKKQLAAAEARNIELQKSIDAVSKEKEDEIGRLKSTYENLVQDMEKEVTDGQIKITQLKDKLSVNIVDKLMFPLGESEVQKEGKQVLDRVGNILAKIKDKQIRIEGHTDNVPIGATLKGKYPTNWELSTARATNIARYLIDKAGIDPKFISVAGYADTKPIDTNDTVDGRMKNRRIEIVLIPMDIDRVTPQSVPAKK